MPKKFGTIGGLRDDGSDDEKQQNFDTGAKSGQLVTGVSIARPRVSPARAGR